MTCNHDTDLTLLDGTNRCGPCYHEGKRKAAEKASSAAIQKYVAKRTQP